ncbi:MAG: DMT family transporter [Bacteroidales bacterium]|nr:DMT family transporter [Bacteroidales bacterium]
MKKNDNKIALGYVAIMFAMLFWGLSFVWIKHLLNNNFPVFTIVFIRLVLASAVFVTLLEIQKKLQKVERSDYKDFLLLAFFEPFLYFIGEDFGLQQVDASFAAVIIALIPIVISVTMYFYEHAPIRWEFVVGTMISVVGVLMLTMSTSGHIEFNLKGTLLLGVAVLAASGYSVQLTRLLKKYSPATVTTWQNFIAIPMFLPFVLIFDVRHWGSLTWDASAVFSLVCLALLCSAGAYMLYSYAVKQLTVTKTSIFTNLIPIVTLLAAAAIGQEIFTQTKFWGIVVIVAGVTFSQMTVRTVRTMRR